MLAVQFGGESGCRKRIAAFHIALRIFRKNVKANLFFSVS
jgi:hypothetical protein